MLSMLQYLSLQGPPDPFVVIAFIMTSSPILFLLYPSTHTDQTLKYTISISRQDISNLPLL